MNFPFQKCKSEVCEEVKKCVKSARIWKLIFGIFTYNGRRQCYLFSPGGVDEVDNEGRYGEDEHKADLKTKTL